MAVSGPGMKGQSRTTTAMRLPPELHAELTKAAEDRGLSINFLVIQAVKEYLPRLRPAEEFWAALAGPPKGKP